MNTTAKILLKETIIRIDGAYAPSTIRAYKSNFLKFVDYCDSVNEPALPASSKVVAAYVKKLATSNLKSSTISIAVASIATIHKLNELPEPTQHSDVKIEVRRMFRTLGREHKQAYGITATTLKKMLSITEDNLRGIRDRALLLVAYDSLCRRSEIVSLQVEDLIINESFPVKTLRLRLRRSKTDQEAAGRWLYLSTEAQQALNEWLIATGLHSGKIFRGIKKKGDLSDGLNSSHINRIYKRIAISSNLDPSIVQQISGHSLRVGAAQDLLLTGASLAIIMNRGRWSKADTVMRYVESAGLI